MAQPLPSAGSELAPSRCSGQALNEVKGQALAESGARKEPAPGGRRQKSTHPLAETADNRSGVVCHRGFDHRIIASLDDCDGTPRFSPSRRGTSPPIAEVGECVTGGSGGSTAAPFGRLRACPERSEGAGSGRAGCKRELAPPRQSSKNKLTFREETADRR